jgi:Kip1 ubiquitination-promoting complex protein 1
VKKWNVSCHNYGEQWATGDVIGVCIDLEVGKIFFSRNGNDLGAAFDNVRFGDNAIGLAYFPAVSLSAGERVTLNFGSKPFVYPVEGFLPLQAPPPNLLLQKASYLLESYKRLLAHIVSGEIVSNVKVISKGIALTICSLTLLM